MGDGTRPCAVCGQGIVGRRRHARYCGKKCQQRAWEDRTLRPKPGRQCQVCGGSLDHMKSTAKFCSNACRSWTHQRRSDERPPLTRTCAGCGTTFSARIGTQFCNGKCRRRTRDGVVWGSVITCQGCSQPFRTTRRDRRFCTGQCRSIAHYLGHSDRYKSAASKRKALIRGVTVEQFTRQSIFDRDGWVCYLCDQPVDPKLSWPDPFMASLDHVVPLSRGGAHSRANTRLAHLRCNISKNDKLLEAV